MRKVRNVLVVAILAVIVVMMIGARWQLPVPPDPAFYVLDGYGGVHPGGGAPTVTGLPYSFNDVIRDIEIVSVTICPGGIANVSVWALDAYGGIHASDGAPIPKQPTPYFGFDIVRDLEIVKTGRALVFSVPVCP